MKKVLAVLLAAVMVFSLSACGSKTNTADNSDKDNTTTESTDAASLVSDAFIDPVSEWSQYDDLIAQIKAETDYAKRADMMHDAED